MGLPLRNPPMRAGPGVAPRLAPDRRRPAVASGLPLIATCAFVGALWPAACGMSSWEEGASWETDRITAEELARTSASNLYEVVEQERPRWLISRGDRSLRLETEIIVALDGRYLGGVETLRRFRPEEIREVAYLDGVTATSTITGIGSRHIEAAIALEMRRR